MNLKKYLVSTSILAMVSSVPAIAAAQDAQPTAQPAADQTSSKDKKDATAVQEVVVTGSRIRKSEFSSAAPVQIVTSDQALLRGTASVTDLLQTSSVIASANQANSLVATGFVVTGGAGIESVSLRGLGENRTLVLINGRRAGPAGFSGTVGPFDVGVIPLSMVDNIQILTDGASSIYGSDAVAGVVNIITKQKFDGFQTDIRANLPTRAGGEEYRASAMYGKTFDKGSFNVVADYWEQKPLLRNQRDYLSCTTAYRYSNPGPSGQRLDVIDPTTGQPKCEDFFSNAVQLNTSGATFQPSALYGGPYPAEATGPYVTYYGGLRPTPAGWVAAGGGTSLGAYDPVYANGNDRSTFAYQYQDPRPLASTVIPGTKRYSLFANGNYDLNSSVHAYGELLLNRRDQQKNGWRQFFPVLYPGNLRPNGNPFSDFAYAISELPSNETDRVDYARAVGGLKGDFGGFNALQGWNWDSYVQYSRSQATYTGDVILDDAAWAVGDLGSAYAQTHWPNTHGAAGCPGGKTPISGRQCININLFGANELRGLFTPAESAFLFGTDTGHTRYDDLIGEVSANGGLFTLPAGQVKAAVGAQFRRDSINDTPGPVTLASNSWGESSAGITKGSDTVEEVFGEIDVPLLKGLPFIQDLGFNGSDRYSHYASYGSNNTYRLALNWTVNPTLRFSGTYGTSFRAPALYELYLADQTSFVNQFGADPCYRYSTSANLPDRIKQNCAADGVPAGYPNGSTSSITVATGGGKGRLKAETSTAYVLSAILTPQFADLSIRLDYWNIEVNNEVNKYGAANILYACYNSEHFPTDPFCSLFVRDKNPASPTYNQILTVSDNYINIAHQVARGLDLTANYRHDLPWIDGHLNVRQTATWQFQRQSNLFGQTSTIANGRLGNPAFVGNTDITITRDDWTVNWNIFAIGHQSEEDFTPGISHNPLYGAVNYRKNYAEFTAYHNVSVRKRFEHGLEATLGVSNVFDEHAPNLSDSFAGIGNQELSSQYMEGILGRQVFFDLSKRW